MWHLPEDLRRQAKLRSHEQELRRLTAVWFTYSDFGLRRNVLRICAYTRFTYSRHHFQKYITHYSIQFKVLVNQIYGIITRQFREVDTVASKLTVVTRSGRVVIAQ